MPTRWAHWGELLLLIALFFWGIGFRLWFISLAPQPFAYDQYEYEMYAQKMLENGMLASHSYRSYPYPLLLAATYTVVGFGNHHAVFYLQAIMDSLIGVMVYWIIRVSLKQKLASWVAVVLYTFNPFTSGYVGVLLSEVLSGFMITATLVSGILFLRKPGWGRGVLLGCMAGFAAETRNAAFLWAAIPMGLALWTRVRSSLRALPQGLLAMTFGVFLATVYPIYVNWRDYHEISVTTVDSIAAREFFNGAILKRLPPFTTVYPVDVQNMYGEYYSEYDPGRTKEARQAMAKKYYGLGWAIVRANPWEYLRVRVDKMWYLWQKENIFFYDEPGFYDHAWISYSANLMLIAGSAIGLFLWPWAGKGKGSTYVGRTILGTILYGTLAFSMTHAEYRLTIPFYPFLFIAAGVGIAEIIRIYRRAVSS